MAFHKAASLTQLPPGALRQVKLGETEIVLCHAGGAVRAFNGVCPHAGGPIGHGALHGTTLVCPWHAWEFDCITGEHDRNPDVKLQHYPVRIEGGDIWVDVP
jgi:nitrite reductase/ring-hydroxylating ferredoxin subunit